MLVGTRRSSEAAEGQEEAGGGSGGAAASRASPPRDGRSERVRPWSREQGGSDARGAPTPYPPARRPPPSQASRAGGRGRGDGDGGGGSGGRGGVSSSARAYAAEAAILAITQAQKAERSMRAEELSLLVTPLLGHGRGGGGAARRRLHARGRQLPAEHAALIEGIARPLAGMVRGALERTLQLRHVKVLDALLHIQHMLASDSAKLKQHALKEIAQVFKCERAELWLGDTFTYGFPDTLTRPPWGFYAAPPPADLSLVATANAALRQAEAAALAAAPTRLGLSEATRRLSTRRLPGCGGERRRRCRDVTRGR